MFNQKVHVVIIGAGFGGLKAARYLAHRNDFQVTVIDRRNHHLFQPLLYQVATAGLSPAQIAVPIRGIIGACPNVEVVMGNLTNVDFQQKTVFVDEKQITYDELILAMGAEHSYFGHDEWENFAPGLKTLEQATEIRRRILLAYEKAEFETNPERRKALLTFTVVGGGPTGVEMAGSIAEISRQTLAKDFNHIDPSSARIILIEAGARLLVTFSEASSARAKSDLEAMGVQVWTSTRVTKVTSGQIELGNETLACETVIWAAGVQPAKVVRNFGVKLDRVGRVIVDEYLQIPDIPNVYVIGDLAAFPTKDGKGLPGLAPVAMQQGVYIARCLARKVRGHNNYPFVYKDKGIMATIGRKKAVVEFGYLRIGGFWAWVTWLVVHIFFLIGFKNRVIVFLEWFWSYLSFRKGARLILEKNWQNQ